MRFWHGQNFSLCLLLLALVVVIPQRASAQPAPVISQPPQNQLGLVSSNIVFNVVASGQSPLSYRWQKNGADMANDSRIIGATTNALTISGVLGSDLGGYRVVVSNTAGVATSAVASLIVTPVSGWSKNFYGQAGLYAGATNIAALDAGWQHSLALRGDGTVAVWGYDGFGLLSPPVDASNLVGVAAGSYHCLALRSNGSVVAWGKNEAGESVVPPGATNVVALAGGYSHSLALQANGRVVAWGDTVFNQTIVPAAATNIIAIATGLDHCLALKMDGSVLAWGINQNGEIDVPAFGTNAILAITAGAAHSVALKDDGTVVAWGNNSLGQTTIPPGATNIVAISSRGWHTLALRRDGTIIGWGYNFSGQATPPLLATNPAAIAAGGEFSLALLRDPSTGVPPSFWRQPSDRTVLGGQEIFQHAGVMGSPPLRYQWRRDGVAVAGQTANWLSLTNMTPASAGGWSLVVSNDYGAATSAVAVLTVLVPPTFVLQPGSNLLWVAGSNVLLPALATNVSPVAYQWYRNGSLLADTTRIGGTTNSTLSVSNVQTADAGNYTVVAGSLGGSTTSQVAVVTVVVPPTISTPPRGFSVPVGMPVTLSAFATGTAPLKYQWLLAGAPVANATNTSLVISNLLASQAGAYQLVATNLGGGVTSVVAQLTLGRVAVWGYFDAKSANPIWPDAGLSNVISVAAGSGYSLALRTDGTLYAWGGSQPTNIPAGLANVVGIAAGASHALALISDGTVRAWGLGSSGQTNVPVGLSNVVAVSAGSAHSAALRADGTVVVWGFTARENQTNQPPGLMNVAAMDAGGNHTLALRANGTVAGWGGSSAPTVPFGLTDVVGVSSAPGFSTLNLAVLSNGTVRAWGTTGISTPALNVPAGLSNIIAVEGAGGGDQALGVALALRATGTVAAWGTSSSGLTNVPTGLSNVVLLAGGLNHAVALLNDGRPLLLRPPVGGTFYQHSAFALKTKVTGDASLNFQWFKDGNPVPDATNQNLSIPSAQVGDAGNYHLTVSNALGFVQSLAVPVNIADGPPVFMSQPAGGFAYLGSPWSLGASVVGSGPLDFQWFKEGLFYAGGSNSLNFDRALPAHGGAYQLIVSNSFGAVTSSIANVTFSRLMVWGAAPSLTNPPVDLGSVLDAAAAYYHLLAIKSNRTVAAWGTTLNNATNVPANLSNVVAVTGGKYFSIALRGDGTAVGWGLNTYGQTNVPLSATNLAAVAAGGDHILALRSNGTVLAWGYGGNGQTNVPAGLSNVVAVSAGQWHSVALKADGTIVGWGLGWTPPVGLSNVVAIAAGFTHTVALRADGTVWTSGTGSQTPPAGLAGIASVASGGSSPQNYGHSLALKSDGSVVGWGNNASGAINIPPELQSAVKLFCGYTFSLAVLGDRSPAFTVSPRPGQLRTGDGFQLAALTVGKPGLNYQWLLNGVLVPGGTNQNLALLAAHPSQAGDYQLVALNEFGSATSAVATVSVSLPSPMLFVDGVVSNGFSFYFASIAGVLYVVEHTAVLNPAAWIELERRLGVGGSELVIDPAAADDGRFYRVRALFAPGPSLKSPVWNGGGLEFQFNTVPGARYVLEYKNQLEDPAWIELSRHDATGSTLTVSDPGPPGESRFYRIKVE